MRTFKKIIDLLTPQETKRLFFILIMGLIMSLLEVFGVASILPFIAVISKPEIIETNAILLTAYKFSQNFGVNTINKFLLVLALFSFLILVFSLIFKSLTVYAQLRFSARRECSLSQRLLEGYVHQPYAWFLNRNSAELGKNIISEVSLYTNYCLFPMVSLISNFIVVIALITLVIFINPTVAFFTFVILTSAYFIIYKSVSFFLKKIANKNIKSNDKRFSALHELFGAIKELKVRGLEKNYMNRYILSSQLYADTLALSQIISQLPRFFLEIIAYGGMIVIVLVLLKNNNEITSVLPVITAYVFAGYKLIPALQGIYQACVNINFGNPRLKLLHKDIMSLNLEKSINNKLNPISLKQNIELKNIYFTYPNITKPTLDNISINISSKSIVGLVGTTGSGKTTLADIILGLLEPQQGKLMIDGKCLDYNSWKFWQKKIGYVPQNIYLCDDTVLANIAIGIEPANIDHTKIYSSAKIANIHNFVINELSNGYNTIIGERGSRLSGGQRQRIGIARAIYHEPELLIFDEATSSLDVITENIVMEEIKKLAKNITIIIIAHRLSTVRDCDNIFLLENGKLVDKGSFEYLYNNNKKFYSMVNI